MEATLLGRKKELNDAPQEIKDCYKITSVKEEDLNNNKFNHFYSENLSPYFNFEKLSLNINDNEDEKNSITDFDLFLKKMKEKLPCVFRVNQSNPYTQGRFEQLLLNQDLLNQQFGLTDFNVCVKEFKLCKNSNLVFNINIPKAELKKNLSLKKFHKFIQFSVDSGMISRQEAVSMLPPFMLNVSKGMKVLDMCAAPGSKTGQFLETINKNVDYFNPGNNQGIVVANDNNFTRAYMMTHQLQRFNTSDLLVVSHDSQVFPNLQNNFSDIACTKKSETNLPIKFDRILADVPCSSDAVMRKLPHKWKKWSPKDAFHLHKLQLSILKKGLALLSIGGEMIYSTCSLSPIENEAIIAEALRLFPNEIELVDCSELFNVEDVGIKIREGLTSWKVFIEDPKDYSQIVEVNSIESELAKKNSDLIIESCFNRLDDNKRIELKKCIRILPHDSDTSGFFITLIRKKSELPNENSSKGNTDLTKDDRPYEIKVKGGVILKDYGITLLDSTQHAAEINWIKNYYGLREDFPFHQLATHSDKTKKINFISQGAYNYLKNDMKHQVKVITAGVKLFNLTRNNLKDERDCKYRLSQDGIAYALPYMTKRIFTCGEKFFKHLLTEGVVMFENIPKINEANGEVNDLYNQLKSSYQGCVVLMYSKVNLTEKDFEDQAKVKENCIEVLCCFLSKAAVSSQISKEFMHMFSIKYNLQIKSLEKVEEIKAKPEIPKQIQDDMKNDLNCNEDIEPEEENSEAYGEIN